MGEYIRHNGNHIKLGTCEDLYYTTYPKYIAALQAGLLSKIDGNDTPANYGKPDSGYRFRFPFPDEDNMAIGDHYPFNRGVPVNISEKQIGLTDNKESPSEPITIEITQQKLIHREEDNKLILATVWRNPVTKESFRIEDDATVNKLIGEINKHHVLNEPNPQKKEFYQEILNRIAKGYDLNVEQSQTKQLNPPTSEIQPPNEPHLLEHLRTQAHNAYRNLSFDPEKRAEQTIREYSEELKDDLNTIRNILPQNQPQESLTTLVADYQSRYESNLIAWLTSKSNTATSMVTGPSNFPTDRMRKLNQRADNKYTDFREWRKKALNAIARKFNPQPSELDQARQNLDSRLKNHQLMKTANAIIRKGGPDTDDQLKVLGLTQEAIDQLKKPVFGRPGFQTFELSNNLAEIKRLQTRVASLEAKEHLAQTQGTKTEEINGIRLVHNYQADRIQLMFPGKPTPETIQSLNSHGFRWTPSQMAWQRKLTQNAVDDGRKIAGNQKIPKTKR